MTEFAKNKEYYESLDKRSKKYKEYKKWKENYENAPDGIGDTVERITEATGIKKVVKAVFGDDCGCDERKAKLNQIVAYKPTGCFTEEQYNDWTDFLNRKNQNEITPDEQNLIISLMKDIFGMSFKSNCSQCSSKRWKSHINQITKFYESY